MEQIRESRRITRQEKVASKLILAGVILLIRVMIILRTLAAGIAGLRNRQAHR